MSEKYYSVADELRCLAERNLSARIYTEQTAKVLGFSENDITVLVRAGLLKPLGAPAQNSHKFFWGLEILRLAGDRPWLDKATPIVGRYRLNKRLRRANSKNPMPTEAQLNTSKPSTKVSTKPSIIEQ